MRILIVEDSPADAGLAEREIQKELSACEFMRVDTRADYLQALDAFQPELIVSDYMMPGFDGMAALKLALKLTPDIPFIILTGSMNEETAVECMKAGAWDYVIKEHIQRLGPAVLNTLKQKALRKKRYKAETALKESEAKYRQLFNSIRDAILVTDMNRNIIDCNAAFSDLFGFTPEHLKDEKPSALYEDIEAFFNIGEHLKNKKTDSGFAYTTNYRKSSGEVFPGETHVFQFKKNADDIIGFIGMIRDITERIRQEEENNSLKAQFMQAQKLESIGRLAGGVAHDFNNLLSVILGNCDLVLWDIEDSAPLDPAVLKEQIIAVKEAGERGVSLIRQILAFSRKQVLKPVCIDVNTLIQNIHKMLKRLIGENITIELNFATNHVPVKIDPGQLEQVIINLTVNAKDAMPNGGRLTIKTEKKNLTNNHCKLSEGHISQGTYAMIEVADTGKGMDPIVKEQIFEPFFTTKTDGEGTGLGLSTVYGIIKQSNGHILVDSTPGNGTIFRIYLPRSEPTDSLQEKTIEEKPGRTVSGTILVAEDEGQVVMMIKQILEKNGYSVFATGSGEEALATVQNNETAIDLLVTDTVMPGMSGIELARKLREKHPGLKILYTSGYKDLKIVKEEIVEKGFHFIQKPFSVNEFLFSVQKALGAD